MRAGEEKNMKRFLIFLVGFVLFWQISAKNRSETPKREFSHNYELIKYYLNIEDFDKAEILVDSICADSIYTDSLLYFKGLALEGKKRYEKAADMFSELIILTKDATLRKEAEQHLQKVLLELHPTEAIEKVTAIIDSLKDEKIQFDLFLMMAKVYEKNQLFEEAVDIYSDLLQEQNFPDTFFLHLKIAENDIFLKKYNDALQNIEIITENRDSLYWEDALFYSYLANYSLHKIDEATENLLQLYRDFPQTKNRFEIIYNLAELFEEKGQYLLSWYFLNELFATGTEAQKFVIYAKIEEIKNALLRDSLTVNQFKYFSPDWKKLRKR